MYEGLTPHDNHDDFEEEHIVPVKQVPLHYNGLEFMLTPANAAVRMFFGEGLDVYNRVIVYPGDGTKAPFKPEDDLMYGMVRGGFPVELPDRPDETDEEFVTGYIHAGIEDLSAELRGLA